MTDLKPTDYTLPPGAVLDTEHRGCNVILKFTMPNAEQGGILFDELNRVLKSGLLRLTLHAKHRAGT